MVLRSTSGSARPLVIDDATGDVTVYPRERLLKRDTPTRSRVRALDLAHKELAVATELFQHYGDGGRTGASRALAVAMEYFSAVGIPHAALRPLEAIMAAFHDTERGASSALFQPARDKSSGGKGAPPKSVLQVEYEGLLAVIAECCVRHCKLEGARDYKKSGLALATRMINKSGWATDLTADRLGKIRHRAYNSPTGSPIRWFWESVHGAQSFQEMPLLYATELLKNQLVNLLPK